MLRDKEFPVYGDNGFKATLFAPARFLDDRTHKRIRLDDGQEILVPAEALEPKPDGSFYLRNTPAIPHEAPPVPAIPAPAPLSPEPEPLSDPPVLTGSSYSGEQLFREDCDVQRVPVRKLLDKPAEPRQEGDTLIVPLMEEVLVLEKRLLLREELHITRRREQVPNATPVRREDFEH